MQPFHWLRHSNYAWILTSGSHMFSIKFLLRRMSPIHFCRLIFLNLWWYLINTNVILGVTSFYISRKRREFAKYPHSWSCAFMGSYIWTLHGLMIWLYSIIPVSRRSVCLTAIYLQSRVISLYHLNSGTRKRHAERNIFLQRLNFCIFLL